MQRLDAKIFLRMRKWRGTEKEDVEEKDINKQIANASRLQSPLFPKTLPCSPSPKSNSLWHKKGEFVLMFVENWENKLDRDLANQNSLQKLSDPAGSRALDKQDWLFQKHAYITPIWVGAITHRQLGKNKPDSDHKCLAGKPGEISRFSMKWEIFLINAQAKLHEKHSQLIYVNICWHKGVYQTKKKKKIFSVRNDCYQITQKL